MRYMSHNEIRKMWLSFFESKGHTIIESASLIPEGELILYKCWCNTIKKIF